MDDVAAAVISLLEKEGISQEELAHRAGVSQPTISRAIRGTGKRSGRARARLLAHLRRSGDLPKADPIFSAVMEIWDGSDAHAAALARLLRASQDLWPNLKEG
jgi:transcriptional regulator with XRE-family HTH domain